MVFISCMILNNVLFSLLHSIVTSFANSISVASTVSLDTLHISLVASFWISLTVSIQLCLHMPKTRFSVCNVPGKIIDRNTILAFLKNLILYCLHGICMVLKFCICNVEDRQYNKLMFLFLFLRFYLLKFVEILSFAW